MFYLALGGLLLLAIFFCWPLWPGKQRRARQQTQPHIDPNERHNALLYRQYAAELEEDESLDAATKAGLLADKARQLLDERRQAEVAADSSIAGESSQNLSLIHI